MMDLSLSELMTSLIFGAIGFASFVYGKKQASWKPMLAGGLLMALPYMVRQVIPTWIGGSIILAALYVFRD